MNNRALRNIFPFLNWIRELNGTTIKADAMAGLTGAVIVLPQGIAFAEIAGMPPIYGLYTAMITPIVAALFGSSKHLISGPTTAISLVIFSVVSTMAEPKSADFIALVLIITLLAGIFQLILGLARMGTLVNYVSHSVVIGFTAGAALLIATSQIKHVFGVAVPGGEFIEKWQHIIGGIPDTNGYVLLVAMVTLITALLLKKYLPKIPNLLVAMIVGSVVSHFLDASTHGVTLVGELPSQLPPFAVPGLTLANFEHLASNAFAIALLGLIEAVAIGRSVATKSNQRIDANQEFVGQGLSNIVGSFFSSYAGSGSFTRSGLNYTAGAKTPMAAIFAAIMLMLILLLVAPLTAYLPIPAMGGIILLVAYNLIDWHGIRQIFRASRREAVVFSITLLSTLLLELEFAIYLGVIFSLIFYLQQTSSPRVVTLAPDQADAHRHFFNIERRELETCPQLKVIRLDGALFFGAVTNLEDKFSELLNSEEPNLLIVGNGISLIDLAGAEMLEKQAEKWNKKGGRIYFCSLRLQVRNFLKKGGYWETLGADCFFETKEEAISAIYKTLDYSWCAQCKAKIFTECNSADKLKLEEA
jgi:SulP family sulfate permease